MVKSLEGTILYVDENEALRRTFVRVMRERYCVRTCATYSEALALLDSEAFALVIADRFVESSSGVDLLSDVRVRSPGTKRMLVTGCGWDRAQSPAGTVEAVVEKPWSPRELRKTISALLARMRTNDE